MIMSNIDQNDGVVFFPQCFNAIGDIVFLIPQKEKNIKRKKRPSCSLHSLIFSNLIWEQIVTTAMPAALLRQQSVQSLPKSSRDLSLCHWTLCIAKKNKELCAFFLLKVKRIP